jgi:hypothetical protein
MWGRRETEPFLEQGAVRQCDGEAERKRHMLWGSALVWLAGYKMT